MFFINLVINLIIITFFIREVILFFSAFKLKKKRYIPLHLLGILTIGLISICTIAVTLNLDITSRYMIIVGVILGIIFFIALTINTLITEKIIKR